MQKLHTQLRQVRREAGAGAGAADAGASPATHVLGRAGSLSSGLGAARGACSARALASSAATPLSRRFSETSIARVPSEGSAEGAASADGGAADAAGADGGGVAGGGTSTPGGLDGYRELSEEERLLHAAHSQAQRESELVRARTYALQLRDKAREFARRDAQSRAQLASLREEAAELRRQVDRAANHAAIHDYIKNVTVRTAAAAPAPRTAALARARPALCARLTPPPPCLAHVLVPLRSSDLPVARIGPCPAAQLKLFTMGDEAQPQLLPMVATLMQFSPDETAAAEAAIKVCARQRARNACAVARCGAFGAAALRAACARRFALRAPPALAPARGATWPHSYLTHPIAAARASGALERCARARRGR